MSMTDKRILIVFYIVAVVFSVRILLALAGITDAVNAHLPYLPALGYIWPVLLHTVYGLLLFCLVIATGTTFLSLLCRFVDLSSDDIKILGYPAGLLVCLVLSLLCFQGFAGRFFSAVVVAGALWRYFRRVQEWSRLPILRIVTIAVLAITFGAHLAFMWRPTTALYAGAIGRDVTTYVGWYHSLKVSLFPFYNLGAEGDVFSYFNNLQTFYAMALDVLPGFDIYLFLQASLPTFYILSVVYMVNALVAFRSRLGYVPLSNKTVFVMAALFVVAARYPSWIIDSPPVVFMVPIAISVHYAVVRGADQPLRLGFALLLAVVGSAISKVVSLAVLGSYAGLKFLHSVMRRMNYVRFIWLTLISCLIAYYFFYMVQSFATLYLPEWDPGPESWQRFMKKGWAEAHKVIPTLLKDIGLVIIVIGTFKLKDYVLFLAALLAVATNFLFSFLFTATPAAMLVIVGGYLLTIKEAPRSAVRLILTGALLVLPYYFKRDPGQWHMLLLWILTLGPALLLAMQYGQDDKESPLKRLELSGRWMHLAGVVMVVSISLTALASGNFRLGKKNLEIVPVSLYDIWDKTRQLTEEGSLIFTDQTGADKERLSGWNDFSLMARRQFYISSWSVSSLRYQENARQQRLMHNNAVLDGEIPPDDLKLSRRYDTYYAVLEKIRKIPDNFIEVYSNDRYALFQIQ